MPRRSAHARTRVVFVRIGWMTHYILRKEPEGPLRGGSFNLEDVGGEADNFRRFRGRLYGYAQVSRKGGFNLGRLGSDSGDESVSGVLVVMFATRDGGGQRLVGWYGDAECHAQARKWSRPVNRQNRLFNFEANAKFAVLLPLPVRDQAPTPESRLEGGFGQANVRYAYSGSGELELHPWMMKTIDWIHKYRGPNMLDGAEPGDALDPTGLTPSSRGQGYRRDAAQKDAVEARSMVVAQEFFEERGYRVEDVHSRESYDLVCTNKNESFRVEVKGTTTAAPVEVELTRGEVRSARERGTRTVLFVVSSIELRPTEDGFEGHGGVPHWIQSWRPSEEHLEPTRYRYHLPRSLRAAR